MRNTFIYFLRNKSNFFSSVASLLLLSVILIVNTTSASIIPQISAGGFHTAALKIGKTVWTWGDNTYGQLGDGTNNDSNTPVQVSDISDGIAIAGGYWHTIALKSDGTVWTWGNNSYGQLGNSTNSDSNAPVQVSDIGDVAAIAGGYWHTIALKSDGTVWTWGNNTYGQLGDGTSNDSNTPIQVSDISDVVAIAGGYWHTIVLKSDGTVWTWGNNTYGQLGDGTNTDRNTPVQVDELSDINVNVDTVIPITGGHWHTVALKVDGTVWACGNNFYGQLGDGSNSDSNTPVQVKLSPPTVTTGSATNVTATSATLNGTVSANGLSTEAWFEYGTAKGSYSSTSSTQKIDGREDTSVEISISDLSESTTYYYRIVAENIAGTTYGSEYSFKTSASSSAAKTILRIDSATITKLNDTVRNIVAVACGGGHTMCIRSDGALWTFGSNYDGQLGDGTNDDSHTPVYVSDFSGVITAIAGGYWHTVAMKSDGTVWAWGSNYNGQLGDGTYDRKNTPVQVQNINLTQAISNIYGYVKDTSGNSIEGATVALAKKKTKILETTVSDANGYFQFENLISSNYIIYAKKQGYKPGKIIIKLEAGETKEIAIEMKPTK